MHLVGFTIEIYYDARSYKRQILEELLTQFQNPILHVIIIALTSQIRSYISRVFIINFKALNVRCCCGVLQRNYTHPKRNQNQLFCLKV